MVDGRNRVFKENLIGDVEVFDLASTRVLKALPAIAKLIWHKRPDIVLSTAWHLNLGIGMIRPLLPWRLRLVAREFAVLTEMYKEHRAYSWLAPLYRMFHRLFDKIICQSIDMRDDMVVHHGVSAKRICVIHNPVDVRHILSQAKGPVSGLEQLSERLPNAISLVAVGRLRRQKGFDLLIDALAILNRPDIHLDLLGTGPLEHQLKEQVVHQRLQHQVHFRGFQPNPYPWIASADALVLSSRFEGLPNVVLEALACGTPVVATPAPGGVREILGNIPECEIASEISAKALAAALEKWLAGTRSRVPPSAVARFEAAAITRQYEEVLIEAAA